MNPSSGLNEREYRRLTCAIQAIRRAPAGLSLDEVAAVMNLSRFEAQKAFTRGVGLSPQRFQATFAKERALERLMAGSSVLDAALASGLSGPGRLHDLMISTVAMTPGQVARSGKGTVLHWGHGETPWGRMVVAWGRLGLVGLGFADTSVEAEAERQRWARPWAEAQWVVDEEGARCWLRRIRQHLQGRVSGTPLPVPCAAPTSRCAFGKPSWRFLKARPPPTEALHTPSVSAREPRRLDKRWAPTCWPFSSLAIESSAPTVRWAGIDGGGTKSLALGARRQSHRVVLKKSRGGSRTRSTEVDRSTRKSEAGANRQ